jgi:hypothetical protein
MVVIKGRCEELYRIIGWKKRSKEHVEVVMSDGHSWNGWLQVYQSRSGDLIYSSFGTGLLSDVVRHILSCQRCRKTYKGSIRQLRGLNKMMDEEWKAIMGW